MYVYYNAVTNGSVFSTYTIGSTSYYAAANDHFDGSTFIRETNTTSGGPTGTYVTNANYVEFTNVTGSSFTLTADPQNFRAEINGIQIVSVPEPASFSLLALSGIGLAMAMRRRRRNKLAA